MLVPRPITMARWVHAHYRFPGPPANFVVVLADHPLVVDPCDWPEDVSGVFVPGRMVSSIGVNRNHPRGRRNFTLWHEFYHYLEHQAEWSFQCGEWESWRRERDCDMFAANVLMPEEWMANVKGPLAPAARRLGVSLQALSLRMEQLGLKERWG